MVFSKAQEKACRFLPAGVVLCPVDASDGPRLSQGVRYQWESVAGAFPLFSILVSVAPPKESKSSSVVRGKSEAARAYSGIDLMSLPPIDMEAKPKATLFPMLTGNWIDLSCGLPWVAVARRL